ncbi:hypothetical protein CFK37_06450 [Virgibacillus phasianinus]|uniref:Inner spore coat protein n=1 Tax=Virgibacillus phasianinus TaxID=2017483 RepID=A0A220U1D4_9BACI|nr:hypothetical protein [Virgibacillus phasianinus]ASK61822.1 hypothetical protein CFK37_06450 [Virgibacillus phasianinus]
MYYPHYYPCPVYCLPDERYFYQQPIYCYHQVQPYQPRPEYPETDAALFHQSAGAFKQLVKEATIILNRLSGSEEFAYKVMDAAQQNDSKKVEELIKSTGVSVDFQTSYNPDGINIILISKVENIECCKLEMAIRWR